MVYLLLVILFIVAMFGYWAYIISNTVQKSGVEVWVKKGFNKIDAVRKIWGEQVYALVRDGAPLPAELQVGEVFTARAEG